MAIHINRREESDGIAVLTLSSDATTPTFEVDLLAAEDVEVALKTAVGEEKNRMLVDLNQVAYMHSRAFWAIVRAAEECARRGGALVVVGLSPYLARLIELTSAAEAVYSKPDVAQGLALLRDPGAT